MSAGMVDALLERARDAANLSTTGSVTRIIGVPICPDLLDHSALGAADNLRGRTVRAFFWLMRPWH